MRVRPSLILLVLACLGLASTPMQTVSAVSAAAEDQPTIIGLRRIGTSVHGRPIRAFHLGDPGAKVTAVILGSMHGDERAGIRVVDALRKGARIKGVNLWVIRTINPDGVARDTRGNARGVDLNRNFRHHWAPLSGSYYSGPRPYSEPESRALRDFLNDVKPRFMVSFHQPLHGVGRDDERHAFQRRLARGLGLPIQAFHCSGTCHGTMTSWYNATHRGTAITVEFGSGPSRHYLRTRAVRGTLRAVFAHRPDDQVVGRDWP